MRNFEPLKETVAMSDAQLAWIKEQVVYDHVRKAKRIVLFRFVMDITPRPSDPDNTIGDGYTTNNKLHDREPGVIVAKIERHCPHFFDNYPRRATTVLDHKFKCGVVGKLASSLYKGGRRAYGKPGLRKSTDTGVSSQPTI